MPSEASGITLAGPGAAALPQGSGAARRLGAALGWLGRYVWAGWAGLAGLFVLAAAWQLGHELYGAFILPSPGETLATAWQLVSAPNFGRIAATTAERALTGFLLAAAIGTLAGTIAGYSFAAMRILKPIVTVTLGVPPIAWIVLALIWFGSGNGSAVMTVVLAALPVSFLGALEGVATRDRALDAMARVFGASPLRRFGTVTLPHLLSYVFPAWTATIGSAWKVTVMAELLSNTGGIGGELATARALFDIPAVTAWILITVGFALVSDYGILHPLREAIERWRSAGLPWGVKR
jgi:NitT/TauT family transport system permease protein